jgi:EAL domain-containing protein (putative c-di-GMP-specific phosphodiesterase class I)
VETAAQLQFLRAHGCDLVQGFLLSHAVPANVLMELLRAPHAIAADRTAMAREAGTGG